MSYALNNIKIAIQELKSKSENEEIVNCKIPIWTQYKEHNVVFEIVKKKMKAYSSYYNPYNDTLEEFKKIASSSSDNAKVLSKLYKKMWEIIINFFSSKEYLASYNPIFFHTKGKNDRDKIIDHLFGINEIDLDKDFYEIMLHLLYKQLLKEKYSNLIKLQKIIRIERKWRSFIKKRKK